MKNKSIFAVIALCAGLQSGVIFGSQVATTPQTWSDWAYSNYAYARDAAYNLLSPYINRMQRVATEQLNVLYAAAQKEAGALGEKLVAEAQNQVAVMMPKIQEALVKGDFDAAKQIAMNASEDFKKVVQKSADDSAVKAQLELKNAANQAFNKMLTNTMKEIDASELASMKK